MTDPSSTAPSYVSRNGLTIAYMLLKTKLGRFLADTHISPLEDFYEKVGTSLLLSSNQYTVANSEVEQFYTNQISEVNFIATAESRFLRGANSPVGVSSSQNHPLSGSCNGSQPGLTLAELKLLSVVWDMYSSFTPDVSAISTKIPRICGMHLWEMFLCLDTGGLSMHTTLYSIIWGSS